MAKEAQRLVDENRESARVTISIGPFQTSMAGLYDLVFAEALLEWLAQPIEGLESLLTAVKPGGFLVLVFYNNTPLY
jgi:S-adenosylmethionine-dependent methyltransferase